MEVRESKKVSTHGESIKRTIRNKIVVNAKGKEN